MEGGGFRRIRRDIGGGGGVGWVIRWAEEGKRETHPFQFVAFFVCDVSLSAKSSLCIILMSVAKMNDQIQEMKTGVMPGVNTELLRI